MDPQLSKLLGRWVIHAEDLELGEVLGRGAFGVVRAGLWRDGQSKLEVAVKQIPVPHKKVPTQDWQKLMQEAAVMAKASERCKYSCRLLGICLMPDHICLVMKRYVTSLENKLKKYPDRKAPKTKVDQWMLEICQGVVEMHNQNIIFRDLKPSNVLLDEFEGAILTDFGIARIVENTLASLHTMTSAGTASYMSPEMFDPDLGPVTKKSDVWALACLLLELQTGKVPWEGLNLLQIMTKVCVKKASPNISLGLGPDLVEVLQKCFAFESTERPSAMEVLEAVKKEVGTSMAIEEQFSAFLDLSSMDGSSYSSSRSDPLPTGELGQRTSTNVVSPLRTEELGQRTSTNMISPHTFYIKRWDSNVDTEEPNATSQAVNIGTSFTRQFDGNCDFGSNNNSINLTITKNLQIVEDRHDDFNIVHVGTLIEEHSGHMQGTGLKIYGIEVANDGTLYVLLHRNEHEGTSVLMFSKNKYVGKLSWTSNMWYRPSKFIASGPKDMLYVVGENKLSGGGSKVLFVWKQNKFLCLHNQKQKGSYCCLVVSPSTGSLYCGSKDGTIDVWDSNLKFVAQLNGSHGYAMDLLAIDHNDTLFSSSSVKHKGVPNQTVWVWCNQINVTILAITLPVHSLACTPTGTLYVGTKEGKIKVWDNLQYITEYDCEARTMTTLEDVLFIEATSIGVIQAWRNNKCIAQGSKLVLDNQVIQMQCIATKDDTYLYSASNHGSIVVSRSTVEVWKVKNKTDDN